MPRDAGDSTSQSAAGTVNQADSEKPIRLSCTYGSAMSVSVSTIHILVDNPDAALAFYRDALGLTVRNEVANGGFRWITLGVPEQPELVLVLSEPHAGRSQEDGDAVAELLAKGAMGPVHLRFSDLDHDFARISSAPGVVVVQEPLDQPWGVRDAAIRDPAGNFLRLEQA